jgi:ATP-dependent exoDNAse (exonuclease V) beta subunit
VRRALRRSSAPAFGGGDADGPVDRLRNAGYALTQARDFPAPWKRPVFDRDRDIGRLIEALHLFADVTATAASERDNLFVDTDSVRRLSRQIRLEESFGVRDLDGWEARLVDLVRDRGFSRARRGSGYKYSTDVARADVLEARDRLLANLQQFKKDADADLAAALQQELAGATAHYQALKTAAGALDFTDLLTRARDLIGADASVRAHLQEKFSRIFVDEFQDTDPVQADVLLLLAGSDPAQEDTARAPLRPGKLFIVGDPKQAIYRFRGTDVGTYWRVSRQIVDGGGRILQLTKSYRSVPAIQQFVNTAFRQAMVRSELAIQADYIPLSPHRDAIDSQPAIVALPVPSPYSDYGPLRPSARAVEQSLPDAVAAFIEWLVDQRHGWTIADGEDDGVERRVPIQPRHIALLFRRFVSFGDDVTRPYADAIEARGIPHLLVGGKAFHNREEVETVRAALAAIEWPDDELSVFAALKGAFFAVGDEQLLEFRHRFGPLHPFRVPRELGGNSGQDLALTAEPIGPLMPIADALRMLQDLHRGRNYRPVAETITRLLTHTRAHVGLILRPAGEQALANVLHVAELARQYEATGGISFRGFIEQLRDEAASEGAEAPILEESSDGVRIMTVHKAKGLEFPVVILADPTCRLSRGDASRYLDPERGLCAMRIGGWAPHELHEHEAEEVSRDQAEGIRLAYVAATRARDLLVVPAIGDGPWEEGWFGPLNAALYPPLESRRTAARGPGCPAFTSRDSVLQRPNNEPASALTVCPGLHAFADGYSVTWWDPAALALDAPRLFGVRREDLIVKDVPRNVVADGRTIYDTWRLARDDARAAGAAASVSVATVREWTADPERDNPPGADPAAVAVIVLSHAPFEAGREGGAAFGALVHALLALTRFDAKPAEIETLATAQARTLGLDPSTAADAARVVEQALGHDLIQRARRASARGACRRETSVTWTLPTGVTIEGIVDLAFEEDGRWQVVDFKTDRELDAAGEERYRRQVAIYAAAIAEATGAPADGMLVRL